ncbi:MAG: MobQ family relaxase [Bradyrhizobium sp.]|nr:MobQ family relaxase [Bradyrhizobium sp.]
MATYRLEAKVISRAKGRSATASAAYRSGGAIEDERTGELFDYSRKRGVLHSEIMAPANTPAWMFDRAALWNAVERVEQRRDAQLARDFIISLPHELTHDQRVALMRDFISDELVSRGMIADFSIHAPDRRSDERNHHAHVMVTMRELTGAGFGLKNRAWNRTELLEQWRAHWANKVNLHLERHGHAARVDHRSLEDQGIAREPEPKQGPIATEMERNGKASHAGDDRRAVQVRNDERNTMARESAAIEAELILLDPDRPRGPAFEDVREALERADDVSHHRPRFNETDGGMVAQQREAMRRFQRNSDALEARRQQQAQSITPPPTPLDPGRIIPMVGEGKDEVPAMVSRPDHLRAEQSKASTSPAHEQQQRSEPAQSQPSLPTSAPAKAGPQKARAANLNVTARLLPRVMRLDA